MKWLSSLRSCGPAEQTSFEYFNDQNIMIKVRLILLQPSEWVYHCSVYWLLFREKNQWCSQFSNLGIAWYLHSMHNTKEINKCFGIWYSSPGGGGDAVISYSTHVLLHDKVPLQSRTPGLTAPHHLPLLAPAPPPSARRPGRVALPRPEDQVSVLGPWGCNMVGGIITRGLVTLRRGVS